MDILLSISLFSCILFILNESFSLEIAIYDTNYAFIFPLIELLSFGFFIVITILAINTLIIWKDWKPILILAIFFLLTYFVPFENLGRDINFKLNQSEREKVVKMVENGEFKPEKNSDGSKVIHLPKDNAYLSVDGKIAMEKTKYGYNILFYTTNDYNFDNPSDFSGFIYTVKDQIPSKKAFNGNLDEEIDRIDKNWYFVSSETLHFSLITFVQFLQWIITV